MLKIHQEAVEELQTPGENGTFIRPVIAYSSQGTARTLLRLSDRKPEPGHV